MVLLDTGTPGTSTEIYSEDADGETGVASSSLTIGSLVVIQGLRVSGCNPGVASSSLTIGIV